MGFCQTSIQSSEIGEPHVNCWCSLTDSSAWNALTSCKPSWQLRPFRWWRQLESPNLRKRSHELCCKASLGCFLSPLLNSKGGQQSTPLHFHFTETNGRQVLQALSAPAQYQEAQRMNFDYSCSLCDLGAEMQFSKRWTKKNKTLKELLKVSVVCSPRSLLSFPHHLHDCQHFACNCQLAVYRLMVD